ncbi:MAG: hypothetical protein QOJ29_273 [Thermoleophilaceae bacterium]|nr:hypothetical protein [Thermoleophilaceae bacterium]
MAKTFLAALLGALVLAGCGGGGDSSSNGGGYHVGVKPGKSQSPAGVSAPARVKARFAANGPTIGRCPVFPTNMQWNMPVDKLPVLSGSSQMIGAIGGGDPIHPDFGSGRWKGGKIGIPFTVASTAVAKRPVVFSDARYSDPGPYPLPASTEIEAVPGRNTDRHALVVDTAACKLYELYQAEPDAGGASWRAGSGAVWDLRSLQLRPDGWTSADAAGLPIFPLLVRYDEVKAGAINHALRIAVPKTRKGWIYPARHDSSDSTDSNLPMMGQRMRLKKSIDESSFGPQARVIVRALKRYGVIVADQGAPWHLPGAPDDRWEISQFFALENKLHGNDFEVVDTTNLPRS